MGRDYLLYRNAHIGRTVRFKPQANINTNNVNCHGSPELSE